MNFMTPPVPRKVPNSEMDKDALAAAICFVDELKSIVFVFVLFFSPFSNVFSATDSNFHAYTLLNPPVPTK